MTKKVFAIVGCILLGLNFGIVAGYTPIFLIFTMSLFPENPLTGNIMGACNIISATITVIGTYVYGYMKKREHESINVYGMTTAISFAIGAVLMAIVVYRMGADPNSMLR